MKRLIASMFIVGMFSAGVFAEEPGYDIFTSTQLCVYEEVKPTEAIYTDNDGKQHVIAEYREENGQLIIVWKKVPARIERAALRSLIEGEVRLMLHCEKWKGN